MKGHRLLRLFRIVVFTSLGCLALILAFFWTERLRGKITLARFKRELKSRGEAVVPADLAQPALSGSNGSPEIVGLSKELIKGQVLPDHPPPRMRLTLSGRAIAGFQRLSWTEDKTSYTWDQLLTDLQTNRAVLSRIRAALRQPVLDNHLDYSQGPKMPFPHLMTAKRLTYWFGSECQLALHEKRLQDCCDALVAEVGLCRFLANDRIVISELVRIALGAIARADTWEALQASGWTDEQLVQIETAWDQCRFLTNFTRSLEGELVFATTTFEICRESNTEAGSLLFWEDEFMGADAERPEWQNVLRALPGGQPAADLLKKQVYTRVWRFAWLDQCERNYLGGVQALLNISRGAEQSLSAISTKVQLEGLLKAAGKQDLYDMLRFPLGQSSVTSLSRGVTKAMQAETERSLALVAIALKRYSLQHTVPPESLASLVPAFLTTVPVDYMDGKPIKYLVNNDRTVLLYSVGADGIDNHGDSNAATASGPSANIWARKDCVWPVAVPPAELKESQRE